MPMTIPAAKLVVLVFVLLIDSLKMMRQRNITALHLQMMTIQIQNHRQRQRHLHRNWKELVVNILNELDMN